jgi:hypothetical protein
MANISRGELGWAASYGLFEGREVLRTKFRDSGMVQAHYRSNSSSRFAFLKKGVELRLLRGSKRLHGDSG